MLVLLCFQIGKYLWGVICVLPITWRWLQSDLYLSLFYDCDALDKVVKLHSSTWEYETIL